MSDLTPCELNERELLIRIDERQAAMTEKMSHFVTQAEFKPVKMIAFGMVSIILSGFVVSLGILITNDSTAKTRKNQRIEGQNSSRISGASLGVLPKRKQDRGDRR